MTHRKKCPSPVPWTHERFAELDASEFARDSSKKDGLDTYCRGCRRAMKGYETPPRKEPPVPMSEEITEPGIPPASLIDGSPDWAAAACVPDEHTAQRLLVIGDPHIPRQHPQFIEFLSAVKQEFAPDRVVCVGDEADFHGISFHNKDPNLPGPSDELRQARIIVAHLAELFPAMDIAESNHGSLPYRKALASGIPEEMIRTYNDILQAPNLWRWMRYVMVDTPSGPVRIEHGQKATARSRSRNLGVSVIQGHRHPESYAEWWNNSVRQLFAVQTGCLINNLDRGFEYNKENQRDPVISSAIVLDGDPFILRLSEAKSGKWDSRLRLARAA